MLRNNTGFRSLNMGYRFLCFLNCLPHSLELPCTVFLSYVHFETPTIFLPNRSITVARYSPPSSAVFLLIIPDTSVSYWKDNAFSRNNSRSMIPAVGSAHSLDWDARFWKISSISCNGFGICLSKYTAYFYWYPVPCQPWQHLGFSNVLLTAFSLNSSL